MIRNLIEINPSEQPCFQGKAGRAAHHLWREAREIIETDPPIEVTTDGFR